MLIDFLGISYVWVYEIQLYEARKANCCSMFIYMKKFFVLKFNRLGFENGLDRHTE